VSKAESLTDSLAKPSDEMLDAFWDIAKAAVPDLADDYELMRIGGSEEMVTRINDLIGQGEKSATFALPWLLDATGGDTPQVGDAKVVLNADGTPAMVLRLTAVDPVKFGDIGPEHLKMEGPAMRDIKVWRPMHLEHWNHQLERHGHSVTDDMPVLLTPWEVVYSA
jgi:uncharacterized protein YhfF